MGGWIDRYWEWMNPGSNERTEWSDGGGRKEEFINM